MALDSFIEDFDLLDISDTRKYFQDQKHEIDCVTTASFVEMLLALLNRFNPSLTNSSVLQREIPFKATSSAPSKRAASSAPCSPSPSPRNSAVAAPSCSPPSSSALEGP